MNVRVLAHEAIGKILDKGGYSNIVINEVLNKFEFSDEDKSLFTKLVMGTVEYKIRIMFYLEPYLRKKQKPWVTNLLMMSVYQIVFLDIPEYAIVNEAVEIANIKDRSVGSFVNAVLRNFLRDERRRYDTLDDLKRLSVQYSYPGWLVAYLLKDYSKDVVEKIFIEYQEAKRTGIRINTLKANNEEVIAILESEGIEYYPTELVKNGIQVKEPLMHHNLFISGKITIQDLASQLVAEVLNPQEGAVILDLCSAPGGKTAHLASLMNNTGEIFACDIHQHKLNLMKKNFKRLGVNNVSLQLIDARKVREHVLEEAFDFVLADLPCSGLGVLGHRVDLKYHITKADIDDIIKLQEEILENTHMLVKPGGYYVMSTCTINKLENEEQMGKFLKKHPNFEKVEERTILPFDYHCDGFYICKLRRK